MSIASPTKRRKTLFNIKRNRYIPEEVKTNIKDTFREYEDVFPVILNKKDNITHEKIALRESALETILNEPTVSLSDKKCVRRVYSDILLWYQVSLAKTAREKLIDSVKE